MTALRCEVAVVGGGPAGALVARALAEFGREVILCEAETFPRSHVGVCLNAGAARMLAQSGLDHLLRDPAHHPVRRARRAWDTSAWEEGPRDDLICDRGVLDRDLLAAAAAAGVRLMQPARVDRRIAHEQGWTLTAFTASGPRRIEARFVIEASGRRQAGRRRRIAPPILALSAHWPGGVEAIGLAALERSWVWTAPAADGETLVLTALDPRDREVLDSGVEQAHADLARQSGLLMVGQQPQGPVSAIDATPFEYFSVDCASLRIGEAALGLDPLSSSGLSAAIQSALSGAVIVNTLLQPDGDHDAALQYARAAHDRREIVHSARTASAYAAVVPRHPTPFWHERAAGAEADIAVPRVAPLPGTGIHLARAAMLRIADSPCITGERVERLPAVELAESGEPIAFVDGVAVASLLQKVAGPTPAEQLVREWSAQIGSARALRVLSWAWQNRCLVAQ